MRLSCFPPVLWIISCCPLPRFRTSAHHPTFSHWCGRMDNHEGTWPEVAPGESGGLPYQKSSDFDPKSIGDYLIISNFSGRPKKSPLRFLLPKITRQKGWIYYSGRLQEFIGFSTHPASFPPLIPSKSIWQYIRADALCGEQNPNLWLEQNPNLSRILTCSNASDQKSHKKILKLSQSAIKGTDPLLVQFQMLAEKKTAQSEDAKFWEFSYQPDWAPHT